MQQFGQTEGRHPQRIERRIAPGLDTARRQAGGTKTFQRRAAQTGQPVGSALFGDPAFHIGAAAAVAAPGMPVPPRFAAAGEYSRDLKYCR